MEIISNCAQKVPRFDAAKRLVPCTSHGALVEPATNKLCIEENNFGTEDRRFGSNAFPHTDQAPGTSWNAFLDPISASQIFSSGVKILASTWDSQNVLHISEEDARIQPPCLRIVPGHRACGLCSELHAHVCACHGQTLSKLRYWEPSTF